MASARPIVLVTDFGVDNFYVGVLRAVIAAGSPASRVLDLDHAVPAHDVAAASFVLARAFEYLPADAVVVVVVDPGVGSERRGLIVSIGERQLVGPDNGFASDLLASGVSPQLCAIDEVATGRAIGARARGGTFHGRDLFGPVAAALARGGRADDFGPPAGGIVMLRSVPSVSIDAGRVSGTGRYVDRFGNVLSDIPLAVVRRVCADESLARVTIGGHDVGPLRRTYSEGGAGELMAVVNSWGLVEAAVPGARAIDRLGGGPPPAIRFEIRGG
jgi:S-adenosylmethionine hydrolase